MSENILELQYCRVMALVTNQPRFHKPCDSHVKDLISQNKISSKTEPELYACQ